MTNEEAIAIIENEKKCVNRASKNDYCNRDCYNCELVKTDAEILTALDMAIKALEQKSGKWIDGVHAMGYREGYKDAQKQKSGKWIKTTDRLPEDKTYVLTTIKVPNRVAHARSGWYQGGFFHNDNGDTWNSTDREVVAWMPLPNPCGAKMESEK